LSRRRHGLLRPPDLQRFLATAERDEAQGLVANLVACGLVGRRTDEHLAGQRHRLEAAGGVHDIAERGVIAAGPQGADEHLSGVDPDADLGTDPMQVAQLGEGLLHAQPGAHRPLRIVLVRDRRAEQRHDRVPDDLVDLAAERVDVSCEALEAEVDEVLDPLGIGGLRERRESHEVGEQDRREPSFVGSGHERVATRGAEPGALGRCHAARWATHGTEG
jgi:hypothetical protein